MDFIAMNDAGARLLAAIRDIFRHAQPTPEIEEDFKDVLAVTTAALDVRDPPLQADGPDPASGAALNHLPPPGAGPLGEICRLTREAAPMMPWHYSYGDKDGLAERVAFADLVGPAGPYVSERLRLGLTLVAADTLYKMHAHPARELYFIVSGHAAWTAGANTQWPGPGAFVLHPPNVPHAMQTAGESLLALYVWRGEIYSPPFYTEERVL